MNNILFFRNINYDNSGTVRHLPYKGIFCFAIYKKDIDKFYKMGWLWGVPKENIIDINPDGYNIFALNGYTVEYYVLGDSDRVPELEKFVPEKHCLKFEKQPNDHLVEYDTDWHYQILMMKPENEMQKINSRLEKLS